MKLRLGWLVSLAALVTMTRVAVAEDLVSLCLSKYKNLEKQFELYNRKSAVANGIMDRINTYARETDVTTIKTDDARAWRSALEEATLVGQSFLQNTMEYKTTCSSGPDQRRQLDNSISKQTEDLRISRANINALATGLPASKFK